LKESALKRREGLRVTAGGEFEGGGGRLPLVMSYTAFSGIKKKRKKKNRHARRWGHEQLLKDPRGSGKKKRVHGQARCCGCQKEKDEFVKI